MYKDIKDIKDIIHYIAYQTKDDPVKLDAAKLNKILWFIDIFNFLDTGKPLTDTRYVKRERGPVPEWNSLNAALSSLEKAGDIQVVENNFHGLDQTNYITTTEPTVELSKDETKLVDDIIKDITDNHTAGSISELSYDDIWKMAKDGEELPIYTCLVSRNGCVTDEMMEWARH